MHPDLVQFWKVRNGAQVLESENLIFKIDPCSFLVGEKCGIYENRPEFCKKFEVQGRDCLNCRLAVKRQSLKILVA